MEPSGLIWPPARDGFPNKASRGIRGAFSAVVVIVAPLWSAIWPVLAVLALVIAGRESSATVADAASNFADRVSKII
jgi:hypothetical protein